MIKALIETDDDWLAHWSSISIYVSEDKQASHLIMVKVSSLSGIDAR